MFVQFVFLYALAFAAANPVAQGDYDSSTSAPTRTCTKYKASSLSAAHSSPPKSTAEPTPEPEPTPSCTTSWYEAFVTDTSNQRRAVYFQVRSSNPLIDGRNVALRPDTSSKNGGQRVVVDATLTSPVLAVQIRNSTLYSQGRDFSNNLFDLGPVGGFRNITYDEATLTGSAEFIFQNLTDASAPDFVRSHNLFQLVGGGDSPAYGLYWEVPNLVVNGFIACPQNDTAGDYWQMIYTVSGASSSDDPVGCEYIGIDAVLSPNLN
ncbi:hypothetical protein DRE_01114 [Drechslerella stenobrocha 248]|uniref:Ubiquitin 3 binding protein But2 C-terminal domain-containing protein n=1 Tax=Drechslerella stenobrocha 248 TaxID=1043628 RepID=W7HWI6_9PEZI|nr:hypothetical protein DRE_01114 [Drechslerella stenobrocha 248]